VATVIIIVGHVFQGCRFEPRVFHAGNVTPRSCGLLGYKSYSIARSQTLYMPKQRVPEEESTPEAGSVLAHQEGLSATGLVSRVGIIGAARLAHLRRQALWAGITSSEA
jgi:hypothetical protein